LDDRIKVAAPVAGLTDLQNQIVDGVVENHCDCMFHVNTWRWDYPLVAALAAPRPLLFCNSDKDRLFWLDGIVRTHAKVKSIYQLYGASDKLGLLITEGPHADTQDLQLPVFRWFNRFLKNEDPKIEMAALRLLSPEDLKVFTSLPADQINTRIAELFGPADTQSKTPDRSSGASDALVQKVRETAFRGWPEEIPTGSPKQISQSTTDGVQFTAIEFESQKGVPLRVYLFNPAKQKPKALRLCILDEPDWKRWLPAVTTAFPAEFGKELSVSPVPADNDKWLALREAIIKGEQTLAFFAPRGVGLTAWTDNPKKRIHIRRRFMLLGQTLDGMRVWDIARAADAARRAVGLSKCNFEATGSMAVNALHASFFTDDIDELRLQAMPASFRPGGNGPSAPDYLSILKVWDLPQALEVAKQRCQVTQ
jgi:hypothetical protein